MTKLKIWKDLWKNVEWTEPDKKKLKKKYPLGVDGGIFFYIIEEH